MLSENSFSVPNQLSRARSALTMVLLRTLQYADSLRQMPMERFSRVFPVTCMYSLHSTNTPLHTSWCSFVVVPNSVVRDGGVRGSVRDDAGAADMPEVEVLFSTEHFGCTVEEYPVPCGTAHIVHADGGSALSGDHDAVAERGHFVPVHVHSIAGFQPQAARSDSRLFEYTVQSVDSFTLMQLVHELSTQSVTVMFELS